jgi:hypothetical protein
VIQISLAQVVMWEQTVVEKVQYEEEETTATAAVVEVVDKRP